MTRIRNLRICSLNQVPFFINTFIIFNVEGTIRANDGPCKFTNRMLNIHAKHSKTIIYYKNNSKEIYKINKYLASFEQR